MTTEAPAAPAPAAPSDVVASSDTPPAATPPVAAPPSAAAPPTQPAAPEGPPQKYDLRVPVEHAALLDQAMLTRFEKIARKRGWTNEDAQGALEQYVVDSHEERQEFRQALEADPVYGGQKLAETERLANLTINHIRPDGHARRSAFLSLLNRGGFIHHPEVASFLADIGTLIGEDSPGHRTAGSIQDMSQVPTEDVLWPKKK